MLKPNFMSAADLGIDQVERDALISVLGMLERKEFVHGKHPAATIPNRGRNEFNMSAILEEHGCGTIACLMGWAHIASGRKAFADYCGPRFKSHLDWGRPPALKRLFGLASPWVVLNQVTPDRAAEALRNYLITGRAEAWA